MRLPVSSRWKYPNRVLVPAAASMTITCVRWRAMARLRASARSAARSVVNARRLACDRSWLNAPSVIPTRTTTMASAVMTSTSVNPRTQRGRNSPACILSPRTRHEVAGRQESKRQAIANQPDSWPVRPKAEPNAVTRLCSPDTIFRKSMEAPVGVAPPAFALTCRRRRSMVRALMGSRRAELFPDTTDAEWRDWRWQLRHAVRSLPELERYLPLTDDERQGRAETADLLRLRPPPPPPAPTPSR